MSDEMKVGAAGNQGQQVGQVDGENYDKKKTEAEQQQLTEGLAGKKDKPAAADDETVSVTVLNGESIAVIAKKYGVSVQEIMDLNQKQLKYFKSATDCDGEKVAGFLVGAKIKLPSKANMKAVEENLKTTAEAERKKYEDSMKNLDTKLCDDRTQSYRIMDENFRKEHNIRTKGEYEAGRNAGGEEQAEETPKGGAEKPKGADETPKGGDEKPKGTGDTPEMTDEEFRKEYPYIARPEEKDADVEAPKWEIPQFKPEIPGLNEPADDVQVPFRPKDETSEAPETPKAESPKAQENPEAKEKDAADKVPERPTPLAPDENTPAYEAPKWEIPQFKPEIPGLNEPADDVQVPFRPKDDTAETPETQKKETPETENKKAEEKGAPAANQNPQPDAGAEDNENISPYIKRPDDETPAYEQPSFELPEVVPEQNTQKADSTKTEEKGMPSIQEMSDAAKAKREEQKPWWQFW